MTETLRSPSSVQDMPLHLIADDLEGHAWYEQLFVQTIADVEAQEALRYAAGNFYVNDKPTGSVVGQQPFGGGRASGTNDKAGWSNNLMRWSSPRTVKETSVSPLEIGYPHMEPDSSS